MTEPVWLAAPPEVQSTFRCRRWCNELEIQGPHL